MFELKKQVASLYYELVNLSFTAAYVSRSALYNVYAIFISYIRAAAHLKDSEKQGIFQRTELYCLNSLAESSLSALVVVHPWLLYV